jgi:hypothetical protein
MNFTLVERDTDRGAGNGHAARLSGCGDEICIGHFYCGLVLMVAELMLAAEQSQAIHGARRRDSHMERTGPTAILNAAGNPCSMDL